MASSSSGPRYLAGWIALKLNYEVGDSRLLAVCAEGSNRERARRACPLALGENKRREQLSTGVEREREREKEPRDTLLDSA